MALREDAGSVKNTGVVPSLQPGQYLVSLACFGCRTSHKVEARETNSKCPNCDQILYYMGRSFHVPDQSDVEQWEKAKRLWEAGFRFSGFRCFADAEPLPEKLDDVDDFIARNQDHPMRVRN